MGKYRINFFKPDSQNFEVQYVNNRNKKKEREELVYLKITTFFQSDLTVETSQTHCLLVLEFF